MEMPSVVEAFLREKQGADWLIEELADACTLDEKTIGPLLLTAVLSIIENNTGEPYGFFCDSGYLNLAYGPNGDHVAVELATGKMLFVHHDEFWEYYADLSGVADPPDVRTRMIDTGMNFSEFWTRASTDSDFPCDAYEAEEHWPKYLAIQPDLIVRGTALGLEHPPLATRTLSHSTLWDVYIPIAIAGFPACIFKLLGIVTQGLDKPGAVSPLWVIIAIGVLQTLGIVAMAVMILVRFELAFRQLSQFTKAHPPLWRRMVLTLSIVFLLLCSLLANVSIAFAGGGPLFLLAVPTFLTYIFFKRVAFAGLNR